VVRRGDGDAALTACDGAGGAADTRGGRGGDGSQRRTVLKENPICMSDF
jgi:hypothetical protein